MTGQARQDVVVQPREDDFLTRYAGEAGFYPVHSLFQMME
jgi:hypothetical protein